MSHTREQLIILAKFNETAERFDSMRDCMKKVFMLTGPLTTEERKLFSTAFKNSINPLRTSLRVFIGLEEKEKNSGGPNLDLIKFEKSKIEAEITALCQELFNTATPDFIEKHACNESKVFLWKMVGDFYRYMCEYKTGEEQKIVMQKSQEAYQESEKFLDGLSNINPVKLGMILNKAILCFEFANDAKKARKMVKDAFDKAIADLDLLDEENYKETTVILQMLRDNAELWSEQEPKEES